MFKEIFHKTGEIAKKAGMHVLKATDKKIGDFAETKGGPRLSIFGLIKGWQTNSERYWQQHINEASATGEDLREAITSLPSGIINLIKSRQYRENFQINNPQEARGKIEKIEGDLASIVDAAYQQSEKLGVQEIQNGFNQAILAEDFTSAKIFFLAKIIKTGLISEEEKTKLVLLDPQYKATRNYFDGTTLLFFDEVNLAKQSFGRKNKK